MPKRLLNIHLYREAGQLTLRFVDMYPRELSVTNANGMTYIDHTEREMDDIGEALEWYWSQLNHFSIMLNFFDDQLLGFEPKYYYLTYNVDENLSPLSAMSEDAGKRFCYRQVSVTLPQTNAFSFLSLLIGLDEFIRDYQNVTSGRYDLSIDFNIAVPEVAKTLEDIKKIYTQHQPHNNALPQLSRFVANWLVSELSDQKAIDTIKEVLASDQPSLTQVIRKKLYSDSSTDYFVTRNCSFYHYDKALAALLDRNIASASAIDTLRKQLRAWSVTTKKSKEMISLEHWYNRFAWIRQELWKDMIYSVIGEIANDGGVYTRRYTELGLLSEAKLEANAKGEMVLHFGDSPDYKKYYAKDRTYHNELENDLRKLGDLIGLHFLPNQDFHAGSVIFDQPSSAYLKSRGFHITEQFCKSLVHAPHFHRMFNQVDVQTENVRQVGRMRRVSP